MGPVKRYRGSRKETQLNSTIGLEVCVSQHLDQRFACKGLVDESIKKLMNRFHQLAQER